MLSNQYSIHILPHTLNTLQLPIRFFLVQTKKGNQILQYLRFPHTVASEVRVDAIISTVVAPEIDRSPTYLPH